MAAQAQVIPAPAVPDPTPQLRRQQEQDNAARQRLQPKVDVQPGGAAPAAPVAPARLPVGEAPCFNISQVTLRGEQSARFAWVLSALSGSQRDDAPQGQCIGAQGINVLLQRAQDALVARGFVTSRILAEPQDLKPGLLALTVIPGRIRAIRFAPDAQGQPNYRATAANAVPAKPGDILNLRDIEQGLENFKRVPTAEADIKIEPAEGADAQPGYSDLVISWQQGFPFRVSLSADDSGSKGTGKYQGSATISYDNWWTLNDLFYITLNRDLGGADTGPRGTKGRTLHYSLPYGYWTLATTTSESRYYQTVFGATQDYIYSGTSENNEVKLSRLVYRDAARKTTLAVRAFNRRSSNFIDDTEVQVQQRVVGGWEASVSHREFIGQATVDANLAYKRGTGAFGSLPAPEEAFGEGTSRFALVTADVNLSAPFKIGSQKLKYSGAWRAQLQRTPLTPQDRFSVGGRFNVRGFDGEGSLSGERGYYIRNELSAPFSDSGQEVYWGLDYGHVGGPSSDNLLGQNLAGTALGLRGNLQGLQYELFWAAPVHKPDNFRTAGKTYGFSLNYSF
jgi:hemolysin activation/secretion protein